MKYEIKTKCDVKSNFCLLVTVIVVVVVAIIFFSSYFLYFGKVMRRYFKMTDDRTDQPLVLNLWWVFFVQSKQSHNGPSNYLDSLYKT